MALCVNKSSTEFKRLSRLSGMSDDALSIEIMVHQDMYGRWPELDELSNPDSSKELASSLGLEDKGDVMVGDAENILNGTNESDLTVIINNKHKDYNSEIITIGDKLLLYPVKRATLATSNYDRFMVERDSGKGKNNQILSSIAERMQKLFGIKFKIFNNTTAKDMEELSGVRYSDKNAFILNGDIYINTDNASIDAPIHEMMHMMLGELKFNNQSLYNSIVESISQIPNYKYMRDTLFPNHMEHDAMEEIFVMESAKYITGLPSIIDRLHPARRSMIDYSILRMIDSITNGASTAIPRGIDYIRGKSIMDMCEMFGSTLMNSKSSISDMGQKARIMMNMKKNLAKDGLLTEKCI